LANTDDVIQTSPQRMSGLMNRWATVEFIRRHAFMHRLFHAYRENSEMDVTSRGRMLEIAKNRATDAFRAFPTDWSIEDDPSTSEARKDPFVP
jgi:hypothetical protein